MKLGYKEITPGYYINMFFKNDVQLYYNNAHPTHSNFVIHSTFRERVPLC